MADMKLQWNLGMDTVSRKGQLPLGAVVDAVNADIGMNAELSRRDGYSSVYAGSDTHSLWTSSVRSESFAIVGGYLCKITMPWSVTQLQQVLDAPFFYDDLNGDVVCGSRLETFVIAPDLSVTRHGLERPLPPALAAVAAGGLDAGTYGVAISFLRGYEEGPLSAPMFVVLTIGQGINVTVPAAVEATPTKIRIYRTSANGDVLHRVLDVATGAATHLLGVTTLGRQARNQNLERMLPGEFIRYWNGMLWTVRGNYAYCSEPMWYGVYNPRFNFVPMQNAIRLFEPVKNGIFIGTKEGMFFLRGNKPQEFVVEKLGGAAPLRGTAQRIPASLLGGNDGDTGEYAVIWLSRVGFVVGTSEGKIIERQRRHIVLDGTDGAVVVNNGRIVAVVTN